MSPVDPSTPCHLRHGSPLLVGGEGGREGSVRSALGMWWGGLETTRNSPAICASEVLRKS